MAASGAFLARASCDGNDVLASADELLLLLQQRCGGDVPGPLAIPALRELVQRARTLGLKLARKMEATDGQDMITAWVEVEPDAETGACTISVVNWQAVPLPAEDLSETALRRVAIDRTVAELIAVLDAGQGLIAVNAEAEDLAEVAAAMQDGAGKPWTDFIAVEGSSHRQPVHWRLLDGAEVRVPGSERKWRATLVPKTGVAGDIHGFELCLTSDTVLPEPEPLPRAVPSESRMPSNEPGPVGRDIAPVLRQPIARIIANAETIRTRLAGPLAEEYAAYAADIAAAGQHLLSLVEDLTDLEVVESEDFNTAPDRIDLADVARRAAGILAVRAQERGITIDAPKAGEHLPAIAEFRRVLQVMLNLVGNAIRYAPDNSQVWIRLEDAGGRARLVVADQGPGLSAEQQSRVFEKFERLGRSNEDGGSGLGLYISRRLARAMGGDLTIDSAPGQGARFILEVPADLLALRPTTAQQPESDCAE
ncbi:MAG: sensor histidine kinase [Sphingomonadaceae bacterium]|nr:sensor histidine kinase [Sphingomonadaceae bacterium]